MFMALAVALALPAGMKATLQVPVGDLLGKTPAEVAARLRIEPEGADLVTAAGIADGRRIAIANPDQWLRGSALCGRDGWGRVVVRGAQGGYSGPHFVFIDGRLAHVKEVTADYLAGDSDHTGDIDGDHLVSIVCTKRAQPRRGEMIFNALVFAPYVAVRATHISFRQSEGLSLLSHFRLGAVVPDLDRLQADHPDALSRESQADGHDGVRIRYGGGDIGGDPPPDQAADFDFHIELIDGKVASIRQGYLMRARCRLTAEGAMVCA